MFGLSAASPGEAVEAASHPLAAPLGAGHERLMVDGREVHSDTNSQLWGGNGFCGALRRLVNRTNRLVGWS